MLSLSVFMRGSAKFPRHNKPKPSQCSLAAVRQSLRALLTVSLTWCVNPASTIRAKFQHITNKKLKLSTLLSHNLIWNEILTLLTANVRDDLKPLIKLLRRKAFFYQVAMIRLHITYFNTHPLKISWLLSKQGYDCSWICKCQHFPFDCQKRHLQSIWESILAGIIFIIRITANTNS